LERPKQYEKDKEAMDRRTTAAFAGASALLDRGVRDQLRLCWRLLRDDRVSPLKYLLPTLVGLYVLSPLDPIPDFLLGIGQMDDFGIVIASVLLLTRIIPKLAPAEIVDEHLRYMDNDGRTNHRQTKADSDVIEAQFDVRR
jgi:uncharacterized membrane protein YkvA (DUF1232 family)